MPQLQTEILSTSPTRSKSSLRAEPSHLPPRCVWAPLTFVAVPHRAEVNVVLVVGEEEEAEPRVKGVDGHDEEDPNDVALLVRAAVAAQVHVDLRGRRGEEGVKLQAERRGESRTEEATGAGNASKNQLLIVPGNLKVISSRESLLSSGIPRASLSLQSEGKGRKRK